MLHHLSLAVSDLHRSAAFYDSALGALGYVRSWIHEISNGYKEAAIGNGPAGRDDVFAIRLRAHGVVAPSEGFHVAFSAPSREAIAAFRRAAPENRGIDNGGCGLHPEHGPDYFAAFVIDPDGYRIEAVLPKEA